MSRQEVAFPFLFTTLCATNPRGPSLGTTGSKKACSRASRVEKHEVEGARELRDLLERVARNDRHDVGQPRAPDIPAAPRARIVFDGRQPAAGFPEAKTDPDGAVAIGRANLERLPRAARETMTRRKRPLPRTPRDLVG